MGLFVGFSDAVSALRRSSEDGVTWASEATVGLNAPYLLAIDGFTKRMVAVQSNGDIKYSDDLGYNWQATGINVGSITLNALRTGYPRIWHKNGKFYVSSRGNTGRYRLAISSDGINWTWSPLRIPYEIFSPGPGNLIFAGNPANNQYVTSSDDLETISSVQNAPVATLREILHIESLNRTLFLGDSADNPNWAFTNPAASGSVVRGNTNIIESLWSSVFNKVLFAENSTTNLFSSNAGGPFSRVNTGSIMIAFAEGNGFVVAGCLSQALLKITSPTSAPQTAVTPHITPTMVFVPDPTTITVETIAPLPLFSAEVTILPKITLGTEALLPIFFAELSSSLRIEAEFISLPPIFAANLERSEYEQIYFDTFGSLPLFSTLAATQADLTISTQTLLPIFSAQIIVPPVAGQVHTVMLMPEFSAIISRPGIVFESMMLMPVFEATIGDPGDVEIFLGFNKFEVNMYAEGEYNSVLTFVQVL